MDKKERQLDARSEDGWNQLHQESQPSESNPWNPASAQRTDTLRTFSERLDDLKQFLNDLEMPSYSSRRPSRTNSHCDEQFGHPHQVSPGQAKTSSGFTVTDDHITSTPRHRSLSPVNRYRSGNNPRQHRSSSPRDHHHRIEQTPRANFCLPPERSAKPSKDRKMDQDIGKPYAEASQEQYHMNPGLTGVPVPTTPFFQPYQLPQPYLVNNPVVKLDNIPFKLKLFHGSPDEDPEGFLADFRLTSVMSGWPEHQLPLIFEVCLSGSARRWYNQLPHEIRMDMQSISSTFLTKYKPLGLDWTKEASFNSIVQLPYESVHQYSERVTEKGTKMGKTDTEILAQFVKGLSKTYRTHTIASGPKSLHEAVTTATLWESAKSYDAQDIATQQRTQRQEQQMRGRPSQSNRIVCRYCNRTGHISSDCRLRQDNDRRRQQARQPRLQTVHQPTRQSSQQQN